MSRRRPNRFDMVFIAEYALKMINAMPETIKEIKISGDVLYSYYLLHNEITNEETPILTYDKYTEYYEKVMKLIDISDNIITDEERTCKHETVSFNQFFDNFWHANQRITIYGAITIDLSRFTELECFSIYQIYCKTIIKIPETVKCLSCKSCNMTKLSKVPKGIQILNCCGNKLHNLPQLFNTQLQSLFCNGNHIKRIPRLPDTVEWLYCYDNCISELPAILPLSLEFLSCANNDLTYISDLPNKLIGLYIENNFIRSIPELPKTLVDLFFANNHVIKMPELPGGLKRITCHTNPLREYTPFPPSVKYANIDGILMEL